MKSPMKNLTLEIVARNDVSKDTIDARRAIAYAKEQFSKA